MQPGAKRRGAARTAQMSGRMAMAPRASARGRASTPRGLERYGHPAAKAAWKQMKSATFRVGGVVEPSQLAAGLPAANWAWKQMKSATLRVGGVVERSQLA